MLAEYGNYLKYVSYFYSLHWIEQARAVISIQILKTLLKINIKKKIPKRDFYEKDRTVENLPIKNLRTKFDR